MAVRVNIDNKNREFFRTVAKAAFSNPFGAESLELHYKIAEGKYDTLDILNKKIIVNIRKRLHEISTEGKLNWKTFTGEDRELIRITLLFDVFYGCINDFDSLIIKQIASGHDPCSVPFAKDTFKLLCQRGFNVEEAQHYFAFFYQLRRAWYFIHYGLIKILPWKNFAHICGAAFLLTIHAGMKSSSGTVWKIFQPFLSAKQEPARGLRL